ncbi:phospholipase A [Flavobacterium sp. NRK1]|uniref:phospholipase A n=1 Tax=Flavobacterium sp. NRK1 TaxID=2954929 RepID=UPI002093CDBE|nr:phospholipase A [Flavobacterium sp. NRK1]MCO6149008.1 phospholipase A [Flavobacterium sp. NRK1]
MNMTYIPVFLRFARKFIILIFLFFSIISTAQVASLFNNSRPKSMAQRWELDTLNSSGTFVITPYKPLYILPVRWSSQPNGMPHSGNSDPGYKVEDNLNLNNLEAKFQISFKVKVVQGIFWGHGDIWAAYTQKSHWQIYNKSLSRPFRETNYEPEVLLNFATNFKFFGFVNRMAGISINHQSNGRNLPLSRSWNRVILHTGFESGNWQVYIRPWFRLPDQNNEDDNPDIVEYIGRGDATVIHAMGKNVLSLTASSNLSLNSHFKGYAEFSWSRNLSGNLRGYFQVTHGYGETLIDYNNRQTTIGLGVSLVEWL